MGCVPCLHEAWEETVPSGDQLSSDTEGMLLLSTCHYTRTKHAIAYCKPKSKHIITGLSKSEIRNNGAKKSSQDM